MDQVLKTLISENKTKEAINHLIEQFPGNQEAVLLQSRFKAISQSFNAGKVTSEQFSVEITKINSAILEFDAVGIPSRSRKIKLMWIAGLIILLVLIFFVNLNLDRLIKKEDPQTKPAINLTFASVKSATEEWKQFPADKIKQASFLFREFKNKPWEQKSQLLNFFDGSSNSQGNSTGELAVLQDTINKYQPLFQTKLGTIDLWGTYGWEMYPLCHLYPEFQYYFETMIANDPFFDITLLNRNENALIVTGVGVQIVENYFLQFTAGDHVPEEIFVTQDIEIDMTEFKGYEWKGEIPTASDYEEVLPQTVIEKLENPVYLDSKVPFRFTLKLSNYMEAIAPHHIFLKICIETDLGLIRSEAIYLRSIL